MEEVEFVEFLDVSDDELEVLIVEVLESVGGRLGVSELARLTCSHPTRVRECAGRSGLLMVTHRRGGRGQRVKLKEEV